MRTIFFDENLSQDLAVAFDHLSKHKSIDVSVQSTRIKFGKGISDQELIRRISEENGIWFTRDTSKGKFKYTEILKELNVSSFYLILPEKESAHWNIVTTMVRHWRDITELARSNKFFTAEVKPKSCKPLQ